jgi:prophage regulatory protein
MGKQPQFNDNDPVVELEDGPRSKLVLTSIKEVIRRTSLSRASIYRLMTTGVFPRAVPLHGVRRAFVEAEIDDWVASKIAARATEARDAGNRIARR